MKTNVFNEVHGGTNWPITPPITFRRSLRSKQRRTCSCVKGSKQVLLGSLEKEKK